MKLCRSLTKNHVYSMEKKSANFFHDIFLLSRLERQETRESFHYKAIMTIIIVLITKLYIQRGELKPITNYISHHITSQWQTYTSFSTTVVKKIKDAPQMNCHG